MLNRQLLKLGKIILAAAVLAGSGAAYADSSTPLKIVIGFPPGGALDTMSRAMAEKLRLKLDQTVIVENKPGAGTQIALQAVNRSKPDGNTLLISPATPFVLFPLTYDKLPYDPEKDLTPVAHLAEVPLVASTAADSPYSTVPEYIDWVKKHQDKGSMGMVSLGGTVHFGLLSFNQHNNLSLIPVAYKGAPGMLTDEIGGVLPIGIDAVAAMSELERAGKIKYLGITGTERSKLIPNVPTFRESGAEGFELTAAWYGAFVPAGTPQAVVNKLGDALREIVKEPDFTAKMAQLGMVTTGTSATDLAAMIKTQREGWRPIVKESGFRANQ